MSEQTQSLRYELEDISPVQKRLHVEVSAPYLQEKIATTYRNVTKNAEIDGFRRGKVPRHLIEQRFRKQIEADVLLDLLDEAMEHLGKQEHIRLATRPDLEERPAIVSGQPLQYRLRFETYPVVELVRYEGFEVSQPAPSVSEEEVGLQLASLQEEFQKLLPISHRNELGVNDFVKLQLNGHVGAHSFHNKEISLGLWSNEGEPLPGFVKALVGISKEAKDFDLKWEMPVSDQGDEASKHASLHVTIVEAHERKIPELDDEFAKDTGMADDLQALREKVREDLNRQKKERARSQIQGQLVEQLIASNPMPLPETFVKVKILDLLENNRPFLMRQLLKQSIKIEDMTPQVIERCAEEVARKEAAFQLLLSPLAEKINVQLSKEDVQGHLEQLGAQFSLSADRVQAILMKEDPRLERLQGMLLEKKVLDWVESHSVIQWIEEKN